MKVKKEELQIGDILYQDYKGQQMACKVTEIFKEPLMRFSDKKIIFPVMVDGFFVETGDRFGHFKLSDDIEEFEVIYRENPKKERRDKDES